MSLKVMMNESSGFELHEADEWLAGEIVSIEETTPGQYGPKLKWVIQLDDEDGETWAFCYQKLSPKAKLYDWLRGLDPANLPEPGDVVELEKYVGRRVQIMFERYESGGVEKETPSKIRAEKKPATGLQKKQAQASAAKKMVVEDPDEAPF